MALQDIASILRKLAYRHDLTAEECREALNTVGRDDYITDTANSDGLYFVALVFGLMAKGPTPDELYGFTLSLCDQSFRFSSQPDPALMIDVSGTGGDKIKTFNVGTAVSFVLAAAGLKVPKQATRGYTGYTGSADVFTELGLDPFSVPAARIPQLLEATGVVGFYTPALTAHFKNRMDFLLKLKNIGLLFPTPWHLVSWVYSPFQMESRLYGVFDPQYLVPLAGLFKKLGYKRVMVVHGVDGLDEISNVGPTAVAELKSDGSIETYEITPEQLGIKRAAVSDIQTLSDEELNILSDANVSKERKDALIKRGRDGNLAAFFRALWDLDKGPNRDLVVVNAAAGLYLGRKAGSLQEGVKLAESIITSGQAKAKVHEVAEANGKLDNVISWEERLRT